MLNKIKTEFDLTWRRFGFLLLGNLGYALSLSLFLADNNIAAGGFSGVGIILNNFFPVPIGLFTFALSIPLFVWAFFARGPAFLGMTLISSAIYSGLVDALAFLPCLLDDPLLAAVCGGILNGVSAVMVLRANASDGGTELLAKLLLGKFPHISLGRMYLIVDGCVVAASIIVARSLQTGIYAVICLAVSSYLTDRIIHGSNRASMFYIITPGDPSELSDAILNGMHRGATRISGVGMFGKTDKNILLVVVKPREVYKLKDIVEKTAPDAFVILAPANEVMGEGFSGLDATGRRKKKEQ